MNPSQSTAFTDTTTGFSQHQPISSIEFRAQSETKIREFIARNFLFSDEFSLDNDASLLDQGVLDSLGVVELVSFVGKEFGVEVKPNEVTPANFDSVERLAAYIHQKKSAK
jgi:acyl carrier protein